MILKRVMIMNKQHPNILFLFPDQLRFDWTELNKELPLKTPNLLKLAKRGTVFSRAYTPSPLCSPARAIIATGRDYTRCGVTNNGEATPDDIPNMYRMLKDSGYQVGGVGKFDIDKPSHNWGTDGKNHFEKYGFTHGCDSEGKGDGVTTYLRRKGKGLPPNGPYFSYLHQKGKADAYVHIYFDETGKYRNLNWYDINPLSDEDYCDNWTGRGALDVLKEYDTSKSWFLQVNWQGPHGPFDVTDSMHKRWKDTNFPQPAHNTSDAPVLINKKRQHYAAMIENIDSHIGNMITFLEQSNQLENTLIIFSSDHGEMLGDHDRWGKTVWHEGSAHVPLIMAGPGVPSDTVIKKPVTLTDIPATALDSAGLKTDSQMDSRSLLPLLNSPDHEYRKYIFSGLHDWRMLIDNNWKYIRNKNGENELYDLLKDPNERENLFQDNSMIKQRQNWDTAINEYMSF
jgi:arylsulfatase A-like enzyme